MSQSRSVTWVRVICGRWVAAASSDYNTSVVRIWSISSLINSNGWAQPIAEAYLEGPVANGCWEVEQGSLILALELRPERFAFSFCKIEYSLMKFGHRRSPVVVILALVSVEGQIELIRLRQYESVVAHIRTLHRGRLAFALHRDRNIPSIMNWRTSRIVTLKHTLDSGVSGIILLEQDFIDRWSRGVLSLWHLMII